MLPLPALVLVLIIITAMSPAGASAATEPGGYGCPSATGSTGVTLEVGAVGYDVADGVSGLEWGFDGTISSGQVSVDLGYRRITLQQAITSPPDVLRGSLRVRMGTLGGWTVCGVLHAGGSRYIAEAGRGNTLAGGAGLGVARPMPIGGATVLPYVEARGLGARTTGTVLDIDMAGTGLSLGVETGAIISLGRVELRLTGALDGLAPGLGVTPYPARALRFGMGYRF